MTKKEKGSNEINPVVVRTTNNNLDLNIIKDILDQNKIPYIVRDRGVGGHMRIVSGDSIYGTDILVEESVFERADSIISEFPWDDQK